MKKIALIVAEFNEAITHQLRDNVLKHLEQSVEVTVVHVPGACELPYTTELLAQQKKYDGMIVIGAVIRGHTPHFDYVCKMAQEGILAVQLKHVIPIIFGVLTTDNINQALERADASKMNKGKSFAEAMIRMLELRE